MCTHYAQDSGDYPVFESLFGPYRGIEREFLPGAYRPGGRANTIVWLPHDGTADLRVMAWGVPPWAERDAQGRKMRPIVNARAEKVQDRFWRADFAMRRCLVPATRFAEWTGPKGGRREVWFGARGEAQERPLFALAGLWRQAAERCHFTLVTVPALSPVAEHHHRMPLALKPEDHACWLRAPADEAADLAANPDENVLRVLAP